MLRLTWVEDENRGSRLCVEGELAGDGGDLLDHECGAISSGDPAPELDLSRATWIDRKGFEAVNRLLMRGFRIVGENPLIAEVRKGGGWE